METILAVDLGKSKSVACVFTKSSFKTQFKTIRTTAEVFHDLFVEVEPDIVLIEIGTSAETAAEIGEWVGTWIAPSGPVRTGGHYTAYWRKGDESWVIRSELFVTLFCEGAGCS